MTAATAVLAAYIRRLREGGGQYIDVALVDAGLALTVWEAGAWRGNGEEPQAEGTRHRLNAPYQAFRTQDGYVTIGANNDRRWQRFCDEVIERPDLRDRPEYKDHRDRPRHVEQLTKELQEILSTRPPRSARPRPCSASTRGRYCASWVAPTPRSTRSSPAEPSRNIA